MTKSARKHMQTTFLSLLIVGWVAALLMESSQPPLPILGAVHGLDKVAHFLAFSGLGLLVCGLSFTLKPRPVIPLFSMPLVIVTFSGIIEESYQRLVPGRASSLPDLLADIGGAIFAILLANRIAVLIRINKRTSSI
jgi:VanZ family protein